MIYRALAELEAKNQPGALCTVIHSQGSTPRHEGSKMVVYPDGHIVGSVGGGEMESRVIAAALDAMQDGKPRKLEYHMADPARGDPGVCGGSVEVFVDTVALKPQLISIGAGHVGRAVAHLAKWLGFFVVVSDDRAELCTPEAVPAGDEFLPIPMSEIPEKIQITPNTYLVLTTRGVDIDVPGMPGLLQSQASYIGVIGSKRRWETTRQKLIELGIDESLIERVKSPMGLDIHAETPEEIAVAIMGEIIKLRNVSR